MVRLAACAALLLGLGLSGSAQENRDPKEDFYFVLNGMRHERGKLHSGVCHIDGRFIARDPADGQATFDGPIAILCAFDGETKFASTVARRGGCTTPLPHSAADPTSPGRVLGGKTMKGVAKTHFYDNGHKASSWKEDTAPSITVSASFGSRRSEFIFEYFDVHALGLYHEVARQRQNDLKTLLDGYAVIPFVPKVNRADPSVWLVSWSGPAIPDFEFRFWIRAKRLYTRSLRATRTFTEQPKRAVDRDREIGNKMGGPGRDVGPGQTSLCGELPGGQRSLDCRAGLRPQLGGRQPTGGRRSLRL